MKTYLIVIIILSIISIVILGVFLFLKKKDDIKTIIIELDGQFSNIDIEETKLKIQSLLKTKLGRDISIKDIFIEPGSILVKFKTNKAENDYSILKTLKNQTITVKNTSGVEVQTRVINLEYGQVRDFVTSPSFTWVQVGSDIDGEAASDISGQSVSISRDGTRVAIGAPYNDPKLRTDAGHVRVYDLQNGNWKQIGADIDGEADKDMSGFSVSMSDDGTRVAIGAFKNEGPSDPSNPLPAYGHVRVYELQGGKWKQIGADIDGEAANDQSGYSVSLSSDGTRVAIGATRNDGNGNNSGHVRVYEFKGGVWEQIGTDIDGEAVGDKSGGSVSLSSDGTRVAIDAFLNDGNGNNSGHVRVYELQGGAWKQLGADIDGEAEYDRSGESISLSSNGARVAIGARYNDGNGNNSGHVRVFELQGGEWKQLGTDIDGEAADDQSGFSVSLSSNGKTIAIGAHYNDAIKYNSGHVRVFELQGGEWKQLGSDIDGEAAYNDSGRSVSLSSDGTRVAVGAPYNDGNGDHSGHVRVYELQG